MNFFGHATVACWLDRDPRWVLGAMLPDFASMCRTRLRGAANPLVEKGIALHHATDAVFHGAPTFVELYAAGTEELETAGLGRGPARAVAHVGTELLLDGLLLDDAEVASAYLDAVALATRDDLGLRFRDGGEGFRRLAIRLSEHGLPDDYRSPDRVAMRLEQILARRPRLALVAEDRSPVVAYLTRTRRTLETRLSGLLREIATELDAPGPSSLGHAIDTSRPARAILPGPRT